MTLFFYFHGESHEFSFENHNNIQDHHDYGHGYQNPKENPKETLKTSQNTLCTMALPKCHEAFLKSFRENFHSFDVEDQKYFQDLIQRYRKVKTFYDWTKTGRANQQLPQEPWRVWLILAGRGFGKTRTGAQSVLQWIKERKCHHIAFIGNTLEEVKNIMVEGESGLLSCIPPWEFMDFTREKDHILFASGTKISFYSAQRCDKLRGPQFDGAWIDELTKFPKVQALWDQLMLSLRLGENPQVIVTTTPRPLPLLQKLINVKTTVVTRGTTMDNANNLSPVFLEHLQDHYKGSSLWQQEVCGQILPGDVQEFLWRPDLLRYDKPPDVFSQVVVALDPAVTSGKNSDETGLIVAGRTEEGLGYILEDFSGRMPPQDWAKAAWIAWNTYKERTPCISVVAEVNNGGDIVRDLLKTLYPDLLYGHLRAKENKILRAQPALRLYEKRKIVHGRVFPELEAQMLNPKSFSSPDRMDALVWALHVLFPEKRKFLDVL